MVIKLERSQRIQNKFWRHIQINDGLFWGQGLWGKKEEQKDLLIWGTEQLGA